MTLKLIMKHMGSCLPDQPFDAEIVSEENRIDIRLMEFDSSLFVSFVLSLESDLLIRAYADDDEGWTPIQPTWQLRVILGEIEYEARVVKLSSLGAGSRFSVTLTEFQPITRDYKITVNERLTRDPVFATELATETSERLRPPPNYTSWLDYAVDCMDTRSLEQAELWIDDPAQRYWPEGTTRRQMEQAVKIELAELRAQADVSK